MLSARVAVFWLAVNEFEVPFGFPLDGRENSYNKPRHSKLNPATVIQDTNGEREYYMTV